MSAANASRAVPPSERKPPTASNRLGLDYRAEAKRLGPPVVPIIDAHAHINGPNAANGKKVLDFVLSDESQAMWGNAFLRPVFADKLSQEAASKFLPAAEYARAKPIDLKKLSAAQKMIIDRYKNEVN